MNKRLRELENGPIKVTAREAAGILGPYFWAKAQEQLRAVLPVAGFLAVFQVLALGRPVADGLSTGQAAGQAAGFGILALASVGPILSPAARTRPIVDALVKAGDLDTPGLSKPKRKPKTAKTRA